LKSNCRFFLLTTAAWALATIGVTSAQQPQTTPLPYKASLALTPEFCANEITQGQQLFKSHFAAGKPHAQNWNRH
jgi:hypothetical protein